ncbi:MAG: DUF1861 family protein [Oscillospiraceae bacterium]
MILKEEKELFEKNKPKFEGRLLIFEGVEGFDVYNSSIPFMHNGKKYIYGRVEKREEWARSHVRLFENVKDDVYKVCENSMIYQLEDPFVSFINNDIVLGGTHVQYECGEVTKYYGYFYKGENIDDLYYFTTGPVYMKDIRLVQLADGRIGVFSRPRGIEVVEKYGSESVIGFDIIDNINKLGADVVQNAPIIDGLFGEGEWGGCNQAYLLENGNIGVIGHQCYKDGEKQVYFNVAFEFDIDTHSVSNKKIIGTRECFPMADPKIPALTDCAFSSGIVKREDGKFDLYSGLGDTVVGRIVIENPFSQKIINSNKDL